jgi:hypothetical protein
MFHVKHVCLAGFVRCERSAQSLITLCTCLSASIMRLE